MKRSICNPSGWTAADAIAAEAIATLDDAIDAARARRRYTAR
jgi:hypothetical protein